MASDESRILAFDFQNDNDHAICGSDSLKRGYVEKNLPRFVVFSSSGKKKDADCPPPAEPERGFYAGYIHSDPVFYNRYVAFIIENMYLLISDNIALKKVLSIPDYEFEHLSCQGLKGSHSIFLGFSGTEKSMLAVAGLFAKREFTQIDERVYDSVCEFINCVNGLFASSLSDELVFLEIELPHSCAGGRIVPKSIMYCLSLEVNGIDIDMIVSFDNDVKIEN